MARSLGRAGLRVAAAECFAECDPAVPVLAFCSRYSRHNVVLPSFATGTDAFADAVVDFVRRHPTRVLYQSAMARSPRSRRRAQLEALGCRLALASDEALQLNDKDRTLSVARISASLTPLPCRWTAPCPSLRFSARSVIQRCSNRFGRGRQAAASACNRWRSSTKPRPLLRHAGYFVTVPPESSPKSGFREGAKG